MILPTDAPLLAALTRFAAAHPECKQIGVAVSGGSDSVALMHLCHLAKTALGWQIKVATVDHALRPESHAEALAVGNLCQELGLPHKVLVWDHGGALSGNLMEEAARARYALLADWALAEGLQVVLVAHTANDQAEALLMGLARGAGLDGLCGMRPEWHQHGMLWARPLLQASRQALRDHLGAQGMTWVDDPSNDNDRFTRVRMRKALAALQEFGITTQAVAQSVQNLALSRMALQGQVVAFAEDCVDSRYGMLEVPVPQLHALDPDLQRRFLRGVLGWMGGAAYAPRGPQLIQLQNHLSQGRDATLAGVRFQQRPKSLRILREARAVQATPAKVGQIWDHRWRITGPSQGHVRALGQAGLAQIANWRDSKVPRNALLVSPALWQDDQLLAAPLLGFGEKWQAELSLDLVSFLQAH